MHLFYRLSSVELGLILFWVVLGTTGLGIVLGRYLRHKSEHLREPVGVLQTALLGDGRDSPLKGHGPAASSAGYHSRERQPAILSDEPSWAPKLEIVRVDFSGDEPRIWPAATKESRIG